MKRGTSGSKHPDFLFVYFIALTKKAENFPEVMWKESKLSSTSRQFQAEISHESLSNDQHLLAALKKYPKF